MIKYFSTFSGIGGFEAGIQQILPTAECVGFSEIDKFAIKAYSSHYPNHKNYGDITKLSTGDVPEHNLLVGGFPCQAFSIAGKRRGFADTRGTLFFELARILRDKKPENFIFENVKGLLSHNKGDTFGVILKTLGELGYDVQWQILNTRWFLPQNRERVYIVGHLRSEPRPEVFPIRQDDFPHLDQKGGVKPQAQFFAGTITTREGGRKDSNFAVHGIRDLTNIDAGFFPTLRSGGDGGTPSQRLYHKRKIRRLTPRECAKLQGFDKDWCSILSDTQAYKCYGNAISVPVVAKIIEKMYKN